MWADLIESRISGERGHSGGSEYSGCYGRPPYHVGVALGLFLGVFALLIVGGAALVVSTDRKRKPFVLSGSELAVAVRTEGVVGSERAVEVASQAISQVGGAGISVGEGPMVVGWIGKTLTNLPKLQEYELMVQVAVPTGTPGEYRCLARPRFSSSLGGASRSAELSEQLAREIRSLGRTAP